MVDYKGRGSSFIVVCEADHSGMVRDVHVHYKAPVLLITRQWRETVNTEKKSTLLQAVAMASLFRFVSAYVATITTLQNNTKKHAQI